jgi:hypothetical protein
MSITLKVIDVLKLFLLGAFETSQAGVSACAVAIGFTAREAGGSRSAILFVRSFHQRCLSC